MVGPLWFYPPYTNGLVVHATRPNWDHKLREAVQNKLTFLADMSAKAFIQPPPPPPFLGFKGHMSINVIFFHVQIHSILKEKFHYFFFSHNKKLHFIVGESTCPLSV